MASGFAFECDYCGKLEMHRGQVPTSTFGASQALGVGLGAAYVEPNPPKDWVRVLHYHGGQTLSSVKTFCGSTCAMGHLGAVELEESQ